MLSPWLHRTIGLASRRLSVSSHLYGPAKWLLPAPRLPLRGSATKLQNFLAFFAVASIPPFLISQLIFHPKLSAKFHSLVYAKSLLWHPTLTALLLPPYPLLALSLLCALPFPHAHVPLSNLFNFFFFQIYRSGRHPRSLL